MDRSFRADRDPTELYFDGLVPYSRRIDQLRATGPQAGELTARLHVPQRAWKMIGGRGWIASADLTMQLNFAKRGSR